MTATLTMDQVNAVKSPALKRVLFEQLQFRSNRKAGADMSYWDHNDGNKYSEHNKCLCVPLAGGV